MNTRLFFSLALMLGASCSVSGQQMLQGRDQSRSTTHTAINDSSVFKQGILKRIAAEETAARQAESANATDVQLGRIYVQLGLSCEDAAQWGRSEAALGHAASLFRKAADNGELAVALSEMGGLHIAMGKLRNSEKEQLEALKLSEMTDNRLQVARSWYHLAALSLMQHKYEKARDFSQKALNEFTANQQATKMDKISAQYALALALCSLKDCRSAVSELKVAVDEARASMQPHDFPIGFGEFLLGYAYWRSGDIPDAGQQMQAGTEVMNEQLGWGHPTYLAALTLYAKYLRETKNMDAANDIERRVKQAEEVVDVRAMQSGQGAFGFDGLR